MHSDKRDQFSKTLHFWTLVQYQATVYIAKKLNNRHTKLLKTTAYIKIILVGLFGIHLSSHAHIILLVISRNILCLPLDIVFVIMRISLNWGLLNWGSVPYFKIFTVILAGLKKNVCYPKDFATKKFLKSRFHCSELSSVYSTLHLLKNCMCI